MTTPEQLREEFMNWFHQEPALELANGVGSPENIADWFLAKREQELTEIVREIEGLRRTDEYHMSSDHVYDEALDDVLQVITQKK